MIILVTCGAGYIGSVLVPILMENGCQVRMLDSLLYGGASLLPLFRNPRLDFVKGEIRDPARCIRSWRAGMRSGSTCSNYGALVDMVCTEETPLNPLWLLN